MSNSPSLDQQALGSAKRYMGQFAWPTVLLGIAVITIHLATIAGALLGSLSLLLAVPMIIVTTYLAYSVLHEAVHGTVSGSHQSRRWINEALGYSAAWILMIPMTAHRHEHLAHHRHTNDDVQDPDRHVGDMRNSPLAAVASAAQIFTGQFTYYLQHRWSKGSVRQNIYFCLEAAVALLPRLALLVSGYWLEAFWLVGVAWLLGLSVTLYLFAYIVHRPHESVGRYVDTSTIIVDGAAGRMVSWLWLSQNYHSIHHLFPRVPFYHYHALFAEIGDIMEQKGAPVYRLAWRGLELEPRAEVPATA